LLSEYGGLSSWLVRNVPARLVTAFFRHRNVSGIRYTITWNDQGERACFFDASRSSTESIESAARRACPTARLRDRSRRSFETCRFSSRIH
jgi:hypothetical protein